MRNSTEFFSDEEILSVLRRLSTSSDGKVFIEWLRQLLAKYKSSLLYVMDEVEMRWLQGECRALDNILNMIDTADEKIDLAIQIKNKKANIYGGGR